MVAYRKTIGALIGLAGLVSLGACASTAPSGLGVPQASAVAETYRAEFAVDPRDNGLTWAQQNLLAAIANEYKARGHGPLVISYPQGAINEDAAIGAIAEARTFFYEQGIDWRLIAGGAYDARGQHNGELIFSFTRYAARAPAECDGSWDNMAMEFDNRHHTNFGCAMAVNLAAMVADPRDLVAPRDMEPGDTGRRQTVIDGYRAGESTTSERSDHESGAVSRVGNGN
ncbi:CpaD family pilus assembly protein [Maricaulis sp.]|uniref:CpaD family pilus assembly protein n=1 Tax=Maricaulis sp. TaxID=1486257 RepID=UPI0025BE830C|nr:CpaD family pilus assembly protein [Maricaulis sp.]